MALAVMFLISMGRWIHQLSRLFWASRVKSAPNDHPSEGIIPGALEAWVDSVGQTAQEETERDTR
jgi:hypothetical protein